jgi:F-type H+-transporting ATPase subunit a
MIFTPLEQFSINTLFLIRIENVYLSFTNSSLYLLIATGLIILLLNVITFKGVFIAIALAVGGGNDLSICS